MAKGKGKGKWGGKREKNGFAMREILNIPQEHITPSMEILNEFMQMEEIDLNDSDQVSKRVNEYFTMYLSKGRRPTVEGLALALGRDRHWLWAVVNNQPLGGRGNISTLPKDTTLLIKKAYQLLSINLESLLMEGEINPVSSFFLMKNNFGYKDTTENIVTTETRKVEYNIQEIRERYEPQLHQNIIDEK